MSLEERTKRRLDGLSPSQWLRGGVGFILLEMGRVVQKIWDVDQSDDGMGVG